MRKKEFRNKEMIVMKAEFEFYGFREKVNK